MQFLATTGEDDVLFSELDLFRRVANTVRRGGTGRGNGIVQALDLELGRQHGRGGGRHAAGDHVGSDPLGAFFPRRVRGPDQVRGRCPAGADDNARALVRDIGLFQPRISDRLFHGQIVEGRAVAHKAQRLAVDMFGQIDFQRTRHLAAELIFRIFRRRHNTGAAGVQRRRYFFLVITNRGDDPQSGDNDPTHGNPYNYVP